MHYYNRHCDQDSTPYSVHLQRLCSSDGVYSECWGQVLLLIPDAWLPEEPVSQSSAKAGQCLSGNCEFFLSCWMGSGLIQGSCGGFLYACCHRNTAKTSDHTGPLVTNDVPVPANYGPVVNDPSKCIELDSSSSAVVAIPVLTLHSPLTATGTIWRTANWLLSETLKHRETYCQRYKSKYLTFEITTPSSACLLKFFLRTVYIKIDKLRDNFI